MRKLWNDSRPHERWLVGLCVLVAVFCLLAPVVFADNTSWRSTLTQPFYFDSEFDLDSGYVVFGYPDSTNFYDSLALALAHSDDLTVLLSDSLNLDSLGQHVAWVVVWYAGNATPDTVRYVWGLYPGWTGTPPDSASTVDFVSAYLDAGSGIVDAGGNMVPRRNVRFFLDLEGGQRGYHTDTWALIWQSYEGRPTAAGRVTFRVPANTKITPSGSYYVLRFEARDGHSLSRGTIYSFQLDTLPDPIMIFDATPIY